jgi:DNA-binding NarL/FixJ family response regulator
VAREQGTENGAAPDLRRGEAAGEERGRLTERQIQVLSLVARGLTNRQVGEALGISDRTVRNHMRAVLRKLRSRDRTQAVVLAISAGWIAIPIDATGAPMPSEARPATEENG